MALATRPKPKVQHKKRKAQHHRRNKSYMQTYWPYLPMFAIVTLGVVANNFWSSNEGLHNNDASRATETLTRIETFAIGQSDVALIAVIVISGVAFAAFIFSHWFRVRQILNKGEAFVVKHPLLDITLVAIFTAGVLLTRTVSGS